MIRSLSLLSVLVASTAYADDPSTPIAQIRDDKQLAEALTQITQDPAIPVDDPKERTVAQALMIEGVKLGRKTFEAARIALGWAVEELDQFVIHQVSKVHTAAFTKAIGIDPKKVLTIFGEHGNIGPASVPIVLSKLREMGRLKKGDRVALLGIGSGLNCSMAEVVW